MAYLLGKVGLCLARNMLHNYKVHCPEINDSRYFIEHLFKLRHCLALKMQWRKTNRGSRHLIRTNN